MFEYAKVRPNECELCLKTLGKQLLGKEVDVTNSEQLKLLRLEARLKLKECSEKMLQYAVFIQAIDHYVSQPKTYQKAETDIVSKAAIAVSDLEQLVSQLRNDQKIQLPAQSFKFINIVSIGLKTPIDAYSQGNGKPMSFQYGEGDSTVLASSALSSGFKTDKTIILDGIGHSDLIMNMEVIRLLKDLV